MGALLDATVGELPGSAWPMVDEVGENVNGDLSDYADAVADAYEDGRYQNDDAANGALRDVHDKILEDLDSDDPDRRRAAEEAKQDLEDLGLWDDAYEDQFPSEEDEDENQPSDDDGDDDDGESEGHDDLPEDGPITNPRRVDPLIIDLDGDGV